MSSKNYKIIHNKQPNTTRYRDDGLPINNKYQVYIVEDSNRVFDLIEKDKKIPHVSMIDRFWGHKTQRLPEPIERVSIIQDVEQNSPQQVCEQIETKLPQVTPQLQKTMSLKKFKESLIFDERTSSIPKTTSHNQIIQDIIRDGELVLKKPELLEQVQNLKRLKLLKSYEAHHTNLPGVGKLPYIINDYHSKSTNPGYSRNNKGNFFTR